jgi:molybdopterin converting factor small subunit
MPTLRLFANLREAAGTSSVDMEGTTVGEVVSAAAATFGPAFADGLAAARVWVNGDPAEAATVVRPQDEIALIPPVSGGTSVASGRGAPLDALSVVALAAAILVGNLLSLQWFTFAVVGAGAAWLWDVREVLRARGIGGSAIPGAVAVALAANGAYGWGIGGYAAGTTLGIVVLLVWTVVDARARSIDGIAVGLLVGAIAALGAGGIVYVRLGDEGRVTFYLAIAAAAGVAAWMVQRFAPDIAGVDPNLAALVVTLMAGLVAGLAFDVFTLTVAILGAVLIGLAFLAGRTLGSMLRWGPVMHTERAPGMLTMLDGPVLAAAAFFAAVVMFV